MTASGRYTSRLSSKISCIHHGLGARATIKPHFHSLFPRHGGFGFLFCFFLTSCFIHHHWHLGTPCGLHSCPVPVYCATPLLIHCDLPHKAEHMLFRLACVLQSCKAACLLQRLHLARADDILLQSGQEVLGLWRLLYDESLATVIVA